MAKPSVPRRAADELLLSDGPQDRETLIALMMPLVTPGRAHSKAESTRRSQRRVSAERDGREPSPNSDAARCGDTAIVGARQVANSILQQAKRAGTWIVLPDGRISHRDRVQSVPEPLGGATEVNQRAVEAIIAERSGFIIPTLDELRGLARLVAASEEERDAIVATYVVLPGRGKKSTLTSYDMTADQFADLGLFGLRSHNTVRRAVERHYARGHRRPVPGESFVPVGLDLGEVDAKAPRSRSSKRSRKVAAQPTATATDVVELIHQRFGRDGLVDGIVAFYPRQLPAVIDSLCERGNYYPKRNRVRRRGGVVIEATERFGT